MLLPPLLSCQSTTIPQSLNKHWYTLVLPLLRNTEMGIFPLHKPPSRSLPSSQPMLLALKHLAPTWNNSCRPNERIPLLLSGEQSLQHLLQTTPPWSASLFSHLLHPHLRSPLDRPWLEPRE